jgi:hypothetical protein
MARRKARRLTMQEGHAVIRVPFFCAFFCAELLRKKVARLPRAQIARRNECAEVPELDVKTDLLQSLPPD